MFAYLLTAPDLNKRYRVYCKTPRFIEESSGYALDLGPTSKDELFSWAKELNSCFCVGSNLLIAKAVALKENRPGLFWLKTDASFYMLPVRFLWPVDSKILNILLETGFKTIGSLRKIPREALFSRFGEEGLKIHSYCRGKYPFSIPFNPPYFEKVFEKQNPERVLFFLKKEVLHFKTEIWLASETRALRLSPDQIGTSALKKALKSLFPWHSLTCLIWKKPTEYQKSLFHFSFPQALQKLLNEEECLHLGLTPSRREKVRRANFIWGYRYGANMEKTYSN